MSHLLTFSKFALSGWRFSLPYVVALLLGSLGSPYLLFGIGLLFGLPWSIPLSLLFVYLSDASLPTSALFRAFGSYAGEWAGVFGGINAAIVVSLHLNGCLVERYRRKAASKIAGAKNENPE